MENLSDFVNIFGNGFFPIVACAVMFWQNSKLQNTLTEICSSLALMNERIRKIESTKGDKENE